MILRTESQKIFVETWDESIKIEPEPFVFKKLIGILVQSKMNFQKDDFESFSFEDN